MIPKLTNSGPSAETTRSQIPKLSTSGPGPDKTRSETMPEAFGRNQNCPMRGPDPPFPESIAVRRLQIITTATSQSKLRQQATDQSAATIIDLQC